MGKNDLHGELVGRGRRRGKVNHVSCCISVNCDLSIGLLTRPWRLVGRDSGAGLGG